MRWWRRSSSTSQGGEKAATAKEVEMIVVQAKEEIMATLQEVIDAVQTDAAETKEAVESAAARVSAALDALKAQVQALQDELAAGGATPEQVAQLEAIGAGLDEVSLEAEAISPDETPPA